MQEAIDRYFSFIEVSISLSKVIKYIFKRYEKRRKGCNISKKYACELENWVLVLKLPLIGCDFGKTILAI